ncbi:DUF2690 domain-containing protein [Kitasatospora sp. NPDC058218]|uniref:DUF2690 domain-containing protein n=1 Tax=Kitasatospora sp. NPDC058218 TaxID=3346385 RepID=UPI0036D7A8C0
MKRTNRTVRILFGLAAAATALTGLAAPTASAATTQVTAGCYGYSCNGQDPVDMGCNTDAYTVESVDSAKGKIELRYSSSCRANWARISGTSVGQNFWVQNTNGNIHGWIATGSTGFGNMVNGSVEARACIDNWDQPICTGWH